VSKGARNMIEIHDSYVVLYLVGILLMFINIIRSICCKKGHLFNPPDVEEKMDEKTFFRIRLLYGISQAVFLVLFILCFLYFKSFFVSFIGLFLGNYLPICLVELYDLYLRHKAKL
jgi:hypothetical protein